MLKRNVVLWPIWLPLAVVAAVTLFASPVLAQNGPPAHSNKGGVPALQAQVQALGAQVTALQGQVSTLEQQLAARQEENTGLRAMLLALEGALATAASEHAALQATIQTLEGQLAANETARAGLVARVHELEGALASKDAEIAALQAQLAAAGTGAGVPKTGQTTSYAAGDDGDIQAGVALPVPRFIDNGDGSVKDELTGLVWLKNANCFGNKIWTAALTAANALSNGSCGLSDGSAAGDWRLPNVLEMISIVDYSRNNPALPATPFTNAQSAFYWTSTAGMGGPVNHAMCVITGDGSVGVCSKPTSIRVWPVRGGR